MWGEVSTVLGRISKWSGFLFVLLSVSCFGSARHSIRTSSWSDNEIYVAFDFELKSGEYINREGSGYGIAWSNADVLKICWSSGIGNATSTVIYKLKRNDINKPIGYDLSYVICGDTCEPHNEAGEIIHNGELSLEEIRSKFKEPGDNFGLMMLFAFLGGLILNLMPCVFPIISLKLFTIAKISKNNTNEIRKQTVLFSFGIFAVFLSLGITLKLLKETVPGIGWGFLMQEPIFIFILMLAFLACAIHFLGIHHFAFSGYQKYTRKIGAFFSGVLSGIASASCVGPFSGVAVAGAVLYNEGIWTFSILLSLCSGVAAPYILVTIFPNVVRYFPKPGSWLERFQEFMGYAMLLSCVWTFSILLEQIGNDKSIKVMLLVITMVFCLKVFDTCCKSKIKKGIIICSIAGMLSMCFCQLKSCSASEKIDWQEYTEEALKNAVTRKKSVFLNFTAKWCLNCQYNEKVLESEDVVRIFKEKDIKAIRCDWTNRDERIAKLMREYSSVAVPLCVFIKGDKSEVFPSLLAKDKLIHLIRGIDDK